MIGSAAGWALVVAGGAVSWGLSRWFVGRAGGWGFFQGPNPDIPAHDRPVPLLGGVAVVAGLLPMLCLLAAHDPSLPWFGAGLAVAALLGLYKDTVRRHTTPAPIAAAQAGVQGLAVALVLGGTGLPPWLPAHPLSWVALVLGGVVLINAWNFIDVSDGLAGGVAGCAAVVGAGAALVLGDLPLAWLLAGFVAALAGFLAHNLPPARIFMGDVGSFTLGITSVFILLRLGSGTPAGSAVVLFSVVPLADLIFTVAARLRAGRAPWLGDHRHLSLTLLARGWSRLRLLVAAWSAATAGALTATAVLTGL